MPVIFVKKTLSPSRDTSGYAIIKALEDQGYAVSDKWMNSVGELMFALDDESMLAFKLKYGSNSVNMEDLLG